HREADIAVRMFRPTQLDVVSKKVADLELGAYAAQGYIERHGEPKKIEDLKEHAFIGYDRNTLILDGFRQNGIEIDREFFGFRSDDQVVCWAMVVSGFGIGFNQAIIGDHDARLKRILPEIEIPPIPVWLTAHSALKSHRRIRRVYDLLAREFAAL
ncbi:MAG: LysR substrate-binding domain-containing protein, partial [Rhizobiaceae bacterium]|nr:LysR substrate-binding domain-containing protein [Rhizobiaceae bacterium]